MFDSVKSTRLPRRLAHGSQMIKLLKHFLKPFTFPGHVYLTYWLTHCYRDRRGLWGEMVVTANARARGGRLRLSYHRYFCKSNKWPAKLVHMQNLCHLKDTSKNKSVQFLTSSDSEAGMKIEAFATLIKLEAFASNCLCARTRWLSSHGLQWSFLQAFWRLLCF